MANVKIPEFDLDNLTNGWTNAENAAGYFESNEVWLDAANKVFYFKGGGVLATAGSGVTGQALYSFFKDRWKNEVNLTKFLFPMLSITNEQFEFINGWRPADLDDLGQSGASDITFSNTNDATTGSTITTAGGVDFTGLTDKDYIIITGSTSGLADGYFRVDSATPTVLTLKPGISFPVNGADAADMRFVVNGVYQGSAADVYSTRQMIRTAGWTEVTAAGAVSRRYAGIVTLGSFDDVNNDRAYYVQDNGFSATPVNSTYTGPVNEAVQFYGNVEGGDANADTFIGDVGTVTENVASTTFTANSGAGTSTITFTGTGTVAFSVGDIVRVVGGTLSANANKLCRVNAVSAETITVDIGLADETVTGSGVTATLVGYDRSDFFRIYLRERKKSYADADLADIGVSAITYIVYRFPVTNSIDLNINTTSDFALAGAAIASISGSGTLITVTTSDVHGLYAGAPVTLSGTIGGTFDGSFVVETITDPNIYTITNTTAGTQAGAGGTSKLGFVTDIEIDYLVNPATEVSDVVLRGDYANSTAYAQGDVVFDAAASKNAIAQWYYLDQADATSAGADMSSSGLTFTLWDSTLTFGDGGAEGGQRDIENNGTWSAYSVILDANATGETPAAPKEVIYEVAQWKLRSTSNINDETASSARIGQIADTLVFFVGSTLNTYRDPNVTTPGPFAVVIDDIAAADTNNVQYNEALSVTRGGSLATTVHLAPIVVTVTFNFNDNLVDDDDGVFYAYYTTGTNLGAGDRNFGTPRALQLRRDDNGTAFPVGGDVSNIIPASGTYTFNYAYDSDTFNGRADSPNAEDVNITVVAIGLDTGQYVFTTGLITKAGGTFSLVAPLERNYSDPLP